MTNDNIDEVLFDFRTWLMECAQPNGADHQANGGDKTIDLFTLVGQFAALRHDVNLQTKAVRAQQEQNAGTLEQMSDTVEMLERNQNRLRELEKSAAEDLARPLLMALIESHDALDLANREVQRVEDSLLPDLNSLREAARDFREEFARQRTVQPVGPSLWSRFFGGASAPEEGSADGVDALAESLSSRIEEVSERVRQAVASIAAGYRMSVQRCERAFEHHDIEAIPAAGEGFDPELMEAVELVVEAGRDKTEVLDEIRRGFLRRGKVLRCAQVRVAKPESKEETDE